jgi:NAD(P)-dependent dehydrogenase (short-subunit alcohol dehydrogenase family)
MRPAVIITGGAKRVGAAMAMYFARKNFDIALHYNTSKNEAESLQKEIKKTGVACEIFSHDLSDSKGFITLIDNIHKKMPHCNVLINNASVFERCEFLETDEALFDRQFAVNFKAPFFLTQAFARKFGKNAGACVINILDTDISQNQISHFAYLLSKKTLADFTQMAARALGADIRVNGVCPGSMLPSAENYEGYEEKIKQLVPLKNQPTLDELSEAAFWLSGQRSITGQIINVDGGKHVL